MNFLYVRGEIRFHAEGGAAEIANVLDVQVSLLVRSHRHH